jgi:hypothetical protein
VITDILNHISKKGSIVGQKTTLYIISNHIAQQSSEILMPWKGEKTSAIG